MISKRPLDHLLSKYFELFLKKTEKKSASDDVVFSKKPEPIWTFGNSISDMFETYQK